MMLYKMTAESRNSAAFRVVSIKNYSLHLFSLVWKLLVAWSIFGASASTTCERAGLSLVQAWELLGAADQTFHPT